MLTLRGAMTAATRVKYAETLAGEDARAASTREDTWQRAVELLFEHLAVRWTIAGAADRAPARAAGALPGGEPRGAHLGARGAARALRGELP